MTKPSAHTSHTSLPHGPKALKTTRDIGGYVLLDEASLFCSKTGDFDISQFSSHKDTSSRSESDTSRSPLEASPPSNVDVFHWDTSSKTCSTLHKEKAIGYWTEDTFTSPPDLIDLSHDSTSMSSDCPASGKTSAIDFLLDYVDNMSLSQESDVSLGMSDDEMSDDEMSVDVEEISVKEPKKVRFALDPVTEIRYRPRTKDDELETFYVPRETWEWEYEVHLKCLLHNIPMVDAIPKREKRARFAYNPLTEVYHLPTEEQEETKISEYPSFEEIDMLLEENLEDIFLAKESNDLYDELEALLELDLNDI